MRGEGEEKAFLMEDIVAMRVFEGLIFFIQGKVADAARIVVDSEGIGSWGDAVLQEELGGDATLDDYGGYGGGDECVG